MKIAIVTGASSGLGKAFISLLDKNEKLDEIWLVARREEILKKIAEGLKHKTRIFPLDLTKPESIGEIESALKADKDNEAAYLINNAGFGKVGNYFEVDRHINSSMIDLNCRAAVDLTNVVLQFMPKGGNIIEVCSVAAFMPMSVMSVYAASKAFLYRYTRALRWEVSGMSIKVSALCPYWIKDTEFIDISKSDLKEQGSVVKNFAFAQKAETVAKRGLFFNKLNFGVITPGFIAWLLRFLNKFVPACIAVPIWNMWRKL